jgi:hypothetical protein
MPAAAQSIGEAMSASTEPENPTPPAGQTNPFIRNPKYALILSLVVGGFCVYILFFLLLDIFSVPSDPNILSMSDAARQAGEERIYVAIADGVWDCESLYYITGPSATNRQRTTTRFTEGFLTDPSGEILMHASMSGRKTCAELMSETTAGYLSLMDPDKQQELTNEVRLAKYINADTYLELCGYCSPTNSWIGIIMSSMCLIAVFAFYLMMRVANRRWREYEEHLAKYPDKDQ